jgi:hypothetical protein
MIAAGQQALAGSCFGDWSYSVFCLASSIKWSGAIAKWPSVPLNISLSHAQQGYFIDEEVFLGEVDTQTYLIIGDQAGGHTTVGHQNEWARMWFWVDGTGPNDIVNFYDYSPADFATRSYGFQWNGSTGRWDICFFQVCQFSGPSWKNPAFFGQTWAANGLHVNQLFLDANTNSGNFIVTFNQLRDLNSVWQSYPSAATQVDSQCGGSLFPPNCLGGTWGQQPPPYTNWNNGKPAP